MNTKAPQLIQVEVAADLPVLWELLQRMNLPASLGEHFATPLHWKGPLTPGEVLSVWLLFVLSQADHCLNHVEDWVAQQQGTLQALLGKPVLPTDLSDDRLADWLTRLASGSSFAELEASLNRHSLRVYRLATQTIRLDTTTANSYSSLLSEKGLLQFGHSKDDPTRPQIKIAAAVLDPLGMPLVCSVLPGNTADDTVYIPLIREVRRSLQDQGLTYVGDCKMAALATRACIAHHKDFYLCPLPLTVLSGQERSQLLQPVWQGQQELLKVYRPATQEGEAEELVAEGFCVQVELSDEVEGKPFSWKEQRWLVRSQAYVASQEAALERRLAKAEAALLELPARKQGKKRLFHQELTAAAQQILAEQRVEGLLSFETVACLKSQKKRAYAGRPEREVKEWYFKVRVARQEKEIQEKKREMGWQVYGSNNSAQSLEQVVWAYRGQYRIEDDWSRLKGQPLSLTPMYLQDERRIQGLVHLLSLALRVLCLLEWQVREQLQKEGSTLRGIHPGQKGRQNKRPSAELLLRALKTITLTAVEVDGSVHVFLSPLKPIQVRILQLLNLPSDLYEKVARNFSISPQNTSEP
jgi:transposase